MYSEVSGEKEYNIMSIITQQDTWLSSIVFLKICKLKTVKDKAKSMVGILIVELMDFSFWMAV